MLFYGKDFKIFKVAVAYRICMQNFTVIGGKICGNLQCYTRHATLIELSISLCESSESF